MNKDKVLERLISEWTQHDKIIVGVDFDDTLYPYRTASQEDCNKVIDLLRTIKERVGAYIVIHTACNPDRYDEIKHYCEKVKLEIDGINITPIDLPFGKNGSKIYANIFLDDRAGLDESLEVLERAAWRIIGQRKGKELKELDDVA